MQHGWRAKPRYQICVGVQQYLRENGNSDLDIFQDSRYKLFQDSLDSQWKSLTSSGLGKQRKQVKPITEEGELLWSKCSLGDNEPKTLVGCFPLCLTIRSETSGTNKEKMERHFSSKVNFQRDRSVPFTFRPKFRLLHSEVRLETRVFVNGSDQTDRSKRTTSRSAYHLNRIFGNSGENSKWNGSSRWNVFGKKVIPFEVFPFSRFDRNALKFLYHLSTITSARENRPFHLFFNWNNPFFWQMIQHIPIFSF